MFQNENGNDVSKKKQRGHVKKRKKDTGEIFLVNEEISDWMVELLNEWVSELAHGWVSEWMSELVKSEWMGMWMNE